MKPGGGHAKGSEFERKVCKQLSRWLSNGKRDDLLWRTAMSGGRATIQLRRGIINRAQAGDVSAIDSAGERLTDLFILECKHVRSIDFLQTVACRRGFLYKVWTGMLNTEAKKPREERRQPMIIARQNGIRTVLVTTRHGRTHLLGVEGGILAPHPSLICLVPHLNMVVIDFDYFTEQVRCRL